MKFMLYMGVVWRCMLCALWCTVFWFIIKYSLLSIVYLYLCCFSIRVVYRGCFCLTQVFFLQFGFCYLDLSTNLCNSDEPAPSIYREVAFQKLNTIFVSLLWCKSSILFSLLKLIILNHDIFKGYWTDCFELDTKIIANITKAGTKEIILNHDAKNMLILFDWKSSFSWKDVFLRCVCHYCLCYSTSEKWNQ